MHQTRGLKLGALRLCVTNGCSLTCVCVGGCVCGWVCGWVCGCGCLCVRVYAPPPPPTVVEAHGAVDGAARVQPAEVEQAVEDGAVLAQVVLLHLRQVLVLRVGLALSTALLCSPGLKPGGFKLWVNCMQLDPAPWPTPQTRFNRDSQCSPCNQSNTRSGSECNTTLTPGPGVTTQPYLSVGGDLRQEVDVVLGVELRQLHGVRSPRTLRCMARGGGGGEGGGVRRGARGGGGVRKREAWGGTSLGLCVG
jgi:hypothetical protein